MHFNITLQFYFRMGNNDETDVHQVDAHPQVDDESHHEDERTGAGATGSRYNLQYIRFNCNF